VLEYHSPAASWEREALPIGNGTLGAMVLGPPSRQTLSFNVSSLWTGDDNPSGKFDDSGFGAYQAFGALAIELDGLGSVSDYTRRLDLERGLHTTTFTAEDGTRYVGEALASAPARVIALRFRADGTARLRGTVRLEGAHGETTRSPGTRKIELSGALDNGLEYAALVGAEADGELRVAGDSLRFSGCRALTLYLAADTSYALDPKTSFRSGRPGPRVLEAVTRALDDGFERLLEAHVKDHRALFSRVDVDFGESDEEVRTRTIDERVEHYQPGGDPELLATLFHYGRYLLIASSRPGGLPANLQGIWNHDNNPPWHSDYHTNINIQMNYWLTEPANLSECHLPLFDLLDATLDQARTATRASFGTDTPGFTYRTSHRMLTCLCRKGLRNTHRSRTLRASLCARVT
jgi:alpha-L-fucosidase 2